MIDTSGYRRFERVDEVEETARGIEAALHGERLRVDVVRDDVVRLKISRGGTFDETPTFALCVDPMAEPAGFTVQHGEDATVVRTGALVVTVGLDPFRLDVHRPDGSAVIETAVDPEGRPQAYVTRNDAWALRRRCRPEDAIYGLGEKAGTHNRKGRDFTLWNTDVLDDAATAEFIAGRDDHDPRADPTSAEFDPYYVSIPFFHHHAQPSGAVGSSFIDNGHRAFYDFTAADEYAVHFEGGQYTEYVFAGPGLPGILEAYTWLTGRMALPPLWALGYHQCRWFKYTQDAVEALGARHRELDLPCDVLWLDIDYMDGYRVFTWDEDAFPDPPGMLERLREQGLRVITIIDPGVKADPGYEIYDRGLERDVFCRTEGGDVYIGQVWPGDTAFPDFVTEEARAWWGELNAAHVQSGLAGIWNDMNEPATGVIPPGRMRFGRGRHPHEQFHNQYALLMAMSTVTGLRDAMPELRTFVLTRAGSPGIQRYAANWMGDNQSRWDHMWVSIPMAAGFGLSGQPFVGADVGGFMGYAEPEMFLRWMQYGALTPFCRNHSMMGNVDQYAWSWGETVLAHVREAIELRYRLLPYLYASFVRASETGAPVQRPLVFDFQRDAAVRDVDDEYLLGPDLLVAPVLEPGRTARQVYLPAGDWYDWHTGERHAGSRWVVAPTPMERIPVFARAGAVVPMWAQAPPSTSGFHPELVELHVFAPAADGEWTSLLQEDDGLTLAALAGACLRTTFTLARAGGELTLRAEVAGDGYAEFAREAFELVFHGAAPAAVEHAGEQVGVSDGRARVPNAGAAFTARWRAEG
jgi:alpha-glucosidase